MLWRVFSQWLTSEDMFGHFFYLWKCESIKLPELTVHRKKRVLTEYDRDKGRLCCDTPDLRTSLVRLRGVLSSGFTSPASAALCGITALVTLPEHVVRLCTATKMPAETVGGSTPSHVWTRTFQCSSTNLGGRGQTRHWTHASGDIWGNSVGLTRTM